MSAISATGSMRSLNWPRRGRNRWHRCWPAPTACSPNSAPTVFAPGLRAGGGDPERRLALFSLSDPRAFDLFEQATGDIGFTDVERALKAYLIALFRQKPFIRAVAGTPGDTLQRRASFERQFVQVPARMRGVATSSVKKVYRAMLAHIGAHLVHSGPRFQVRGLKPMQVALVSLIEDARVEQLAMRELPGLSRL